MKLFTFCVDIKRHNQDNLKNALILLVKSLDYHLNNYELIVYTNFSIGLNNKNITYRAYYDNSKTKLYDASNQQYIWLNLSYNKINIYKDLHDEFGIDFVWVDLDTVICYDISYIDNISNIFIEHGGNIERQNILFTNNNSITVPRNRYIQGNFWKLDINLYNEFQNTLLELENSNLKLQYDLQDLFSYYFYFKLNGNLTNIYILGNNYLSHTINGLTLWSKEGNTYATLDGLQNLYYDKKNILKSNYYPDKEIHIISFTFYTLTPLLNETKFIELFNFQKSNDNNIKKVGVFGTCRIDNYNILDFKQITNEYPYVYNNKNTTINVRLLGYTTSSSDILQNITLTKNKTYQNIKDPFIYNNVFLKHHGTRAIFDLDYDYLVLEICSIKKIIHKKTTLIFPYEIEGNYNKDDFKIEKESFEETVNNIVNIFKMLKCKIILLPPIIEFNGDITKGAHEDIELESVLNYRKDIIKRLDKATMYDNNIKLFNWNNEIKEIGIDRMLTDQFHFTEFGKKHISIKILELLNLNNNINHQNYYDFIEIGTSNFNTEIHNHCGRKGLSIEPVKYYLEQLPDISNVKKINTAISNKDDILHIYYLSEDNINKYKLPTYLKGCNAVNNFHPTVIKILDKYNLSHSLITNDKVQCLKLSTLLKNEDCTGINLLKISSSGHDTIILNSFIDDYLNNITSQKLLPKKIIFETNILTHEDEILHVIKRLKSIGYELLNYNYGNATNTTMILNI